MCNQKTLSLSELINEIGEDGTNLYLQSSFACKRNQDVEEFLLQKSVRFEQALASVTRLIGNESGEILGFYTLTFKEVNVNVSKSLLKKLTAGLNNPKLKTLLIGQIAKNELIDNNPLKLQDILETAFIHIKEAQGLVGGRVAILECEDNPKLIKLYEDNGFKLLDTEDIDENGLKTMYIIPKFN